VTSSRQHPWPTDDPPVVLDQIDFAYPRAPVIFQNATWTAPRVDGLVVIRGRSGSGKTTLLELISGLLVPSAGSVRTLGVVVSALPSAERRSFRKQAIGHVFQDFRLLPELNAWENVALPLWLSGVKSSSAREQAVAGLAALDLGWARDRRPEALSGGEQQRVGLARALAPRPRLILADEPTANLDDDSARTVGELLRATAMQGTAVLVASHDERFLGPNDAVFEVAAGKIEPRSVRAGPGNGWRVESA
jgi:putative ABC transport system ATP-binding protein